VTRFFVVWRDFGGPPTYRHATEDTARAEATRLARLNPGVKFHVLGLVDTCVKDDVRWASKEEDGIPF
jgi:hypothetical protein